MNETGTTDYGSNTTSTVTPALAVCKRGTLKFDDTSAAGIPLRLHRTRIVYNSGTFNIGTVAIRSRATAQPYWSLIARPTATSD